MPLWPDGKKFAFTILDDTDCATLQNVPQVYQFLNEYGYRTTKTVWPLDGEIFPGNRGIIGATCQDPDYLAWVKSLQEQGFEIAYHSTTYSSSKRSRVIDGLDCFKEHFGAYPKVLAQHDQLQENESIYWGPKRVSGIVRFLYKLTHRLRSAQRDFYYGEIEESEFFWGDICKERIKYVRNFIYPQINTLRACPYMPYHDTERPFVNYWFASSEAPDFRKFIALMSEENQNRLVQEGGACIIYTHFGKGFVQDGKLRPEFIQVMQSLAAKDGWFVPVGDLLDTMLHQNGHRVIQKSQRSTLEWNWLFHKLAIGSS